MHHKLLNRASEHLVFLVWIEKAAFEEQTKNSY